MQASLKEYLWEECNIVFKNRPYKYHIVIQLLKGKSSFQFILILIFMYPVSSEYQFFNKVF